MWIIHMDFDLRPHVLLDVHALTNLDLCHSFVIVDVHCLDLAFTVWCRAGCAKVVLISTYHTLSFELPPAGGMVCYTAAFTA